MKAAIWTAYGSPEVIKVREVETPVPHDDEVLIKLHASTVTLGDCEIRGNYLPLWVRFPLRIYMGIIRPRGTKILGQEGAGEIVAVGKLVTNFEVGDRVILSPSILMGTHAEYRTYKASPGLGGIVPIHPGVTYEQAATLTVGGLNALFFMKLANITPGEEVLINGAGGSIGTYAIEIAKKMGAKITAVDRSSKFETLYKLGANDCFDFTEVDFTKLDKKYDVIFDIVGKASLRRSRKRLNPGGRYLTANPMPNTMLRSKFITRFSDKTFIATTMSEKLEDYEEIMQMIVDGIINPVIDKTMPLDEIVEAHKYIEDGKKIGHLVIVMH